MLAYVGYILVPVAWAWIHHTRPGLDLRAIGENPAAADAQGINVFRIRYAYVVLGRLLAGLAGATLTLAILRRLVRRPDRPRDVARSTIGLVIFAQWSPIRAAVGAYLFGAIFRFILDIQGVDTLLGFANPFLAGRSTTFFLGMLPYLS